MIIYAVEEQEQVFKIHLFVCIVFIIRITMSYRNTREFYECNFLVQT